MPDKETYQWYKEHGICTSCRKEDAVPGQTRCWRCRANRRDADRIRYHQRKAEGIRKFNPANIEAMKRRREERHAQGLCVECGKHPAVSNARYSRCRICLDIESARFREANRKKGALPWELRGNGTYCFRCCKPLCHGEKLCPACHAVLSAAMKKLNDEGKGGKGFQRYPLFLKG